MIKVYSDASYPGGTNVNYVINELQEKYHFLDKFENYIMDNVNRFNFDYKGKFPHAKFDHFLSVLFREYIIHRAHGIRYKTNGMIEFIDTGLLISTAKVSFLNNELDNFN